MYIIYIKRYGYNIYIVVHGYIHITCINKYSYISNKKMAGALKAKVSIRIGKEKSEQTTKVVKQVSRCQLMKQGERLRGERINEKDRMN